MYTHAHTCTHMYTHVYTCTHMYTYTHMHMYTYTHMHTHVHIHTCTCAYLVHNTLYAQTISPSPPPPPMFLQARDNVTSGRYPMTTDELHILAGYQAAIDLKISPDLITPDSLRPHLPSLYPAHMLNRGLVTKLMQLFRSSADPLEDRVVESYRSACRMREGDDQFSLKILYLQLCWKQPFYGYMPHYQASSTPLHSSPSSSSLGTFTPHLCVLSPLTPCLLSPTHPSLLT